MPDPVLPVILLPVLTPHHVTFQLVGALGGLIHVGGHSACFTASTLPAVCLVMASLGTAFNLAAFLIQTSFIVFLLFGLWFRLSGRYAARRARLALLNAARSTLLADDSAQWPGSAPSGSSPIAPEGVPGRLGHRDALRWPRQEGASNVS